MKRAIALLILLLPTLVASPQDKKQTTPPKKPTLAALGVYGDSVFAKGVWRPDNPTKENEPGENVSDFSCFRHGGKSIVGTEAFCLEAAASVPLPNFLDVNTRFLKVVEWSDARIIAIDDSPICLTSQTIFDLKRKTVTALDIRKPEAKGFMNACDLLPDRQTYYLQDIVDYRVQKDLAAVRKSQPK